MLNYSVILLKSISEVSLASSLLLFCRILVLAYKILNTYLNEMLIVIFYMFLILIHTVFIKIRYFSEIDAKVSLTLSITGLRKRDASMATLFIIIGAVSFVGSAIVYLMGGEDTSGQQAPTDVFVPSFPEGYSESSFIKNIQPFYIMFQAPDIKETTDFSINGINLIKTQIILDHYTTTLLIRKCLKMEVFSGIKCWKDLKLDINYTELDTPEKISQYYLNGVSEAEAMGTDEALLSALLKLQLWDTFLKDSVLTRFASAEQHDAAISAFISDDQYTSHFLKLIQKRLNLPVKDIAHIISEAPKIPLPSDKPYMLIDNKGQLVEDPLVYESLMAHKKAYDLLIDNALNFFLANP